MNLLLALILTIAIISLFVYTLPIRSFKCLDCGSRDTWNDGGFDWGCRSCKARERLALELPPLLSWHDSVYKKEYQLHE